MPSKARLRAFVCCLAFAGLLLFPSQGAARKHEPGAVPRLLDAINEYRSANGVGPLRMSKSLNRSARAWSRHLIVTDTFGHASSIRASSRFRRLGEIIAYHWGWRLRMRRSPLGQWRNSSGHLSLLLDSGFDYAGVGRAAGYYGGKRATVWTVQFGSY
jgi:uncharacterized protein YkwD